MFKRLLALLVILPAYLAAMQKNVPSDILPCYYVVADFVLLPLSSQYKHQRFWVAANCTPKEALEAWEQLFKRSYSFKSALGSDIRFYMAPTQSLTSRTTTFQVLAKNECQQYAAINRNELTVDNIKGKFLFNQGVFETRLRDNKLVVKLQNEKGPFLQIIPVNTLLRCSGQEAIYKKAKGPLGSFYYNRGIAAYELKAIYQEVYKINIQYNFLTDLEVTYSIESIQAGLKPKECVDVIDWDWASHKWEWRRIDKTNPPLSGQLQEQISQLVSRIVDNDEPAHSHSSAQTAALVGAKHTSASHTLTHQQLCLRELTLGAVLASVGYILVTLLTPVLKKSIKNLKKQHNTL